LSTSTDSEIVHVRDSSVVGSLGVITALPGAEGGEFSTVTGPAIAGSESPSVSVAMTLQAYPLFFTVIEELNVSLVERMVPGLATSDHAYSKLS
jgi:hypothetical protein